MTITNLESDGLHSQMIVLARVLAKNRVIARDELISICAPPAGTDGRERGLGRLRASLARWLELGLFSEDAGAISINLALRNVATLDELTDRLPGVCRQLVLQDRHCLPLWGSGEDPTESGIGRAADLARGLSWALAQDIYNLPSGADEVETMDRAQVVAPRVIFLNKTRWPGLRPWARYLGFGRGDDNNFLFDPTEAVKDELQNIIGTGETMAADLFLDELSARLPVLDGGAYRREVEANLSDETWRKPADGDVSMSLSMALRRLELDGTVALETKADAGAARRLTGRSYRTWASFTHVRMVGYKA